MSDSAFSPLRPQSDFSVDSPRRKPWSKPLVIVSEIETTDKLTIHIVDLTPIVPSGPS